jgi:hypothetical protein
MKKYKTGYGIEIKEVEIIKETEKTVWIEATYRVPNKENIRQCRKNSDYENYHDTWRDARDFLLNKAEKEWEYAKERANVKKSIIGNIKAIKQPEGL